MNVTVKKIRVARIVAVPLDGRTVMVTEGLDFVCSCGCVVIFGIRQDNAEKTMTAQACPTHREAWPRIVAAMFSDDVTDTDVLLAQLLSA